MRPHQNDPSPTSKAPSSEPQKVMDVEQLLGSSREVILKLRDEEYRLRITRNEKLILTK